MTPGKIAHHYKVTITTPAGEEIVYEGREPYVRGTMLDIPNPNGGQKWVAWETYFVEEAG